MTLLRHGNAGRLPSPSFQLRQFKQLVRFQLLLEQENRLGQTVITCGHCDWEARRPAHAPAPMRRRATAHDRRRAVEHVLRYHRQFLPDGFQVDP
jgi:hypothetical protein